MASHIVPLEPVRNIDIAKHVDHRIPVIDRNQTRHRLTVFGHHDGMTIRLSQCLGWIPAEIARGHADGLLPKELLHLSVLIEGLLAGAIPDTEARAWETRCFKTSTLFRAIHSIDGPIV